MRFRATPVISSRMVASREAQMKRSKGLCDTGSRNKRKRTAPNPYIGQMGPLKKPRLVNLLLTMDI